MGPPAGRRVLRQGRPKEHRLAPGRRFWLFSSEPSHRPSRFPLVLDRTCQKYALARWIGRACGQLLADEWGVVYANAAGPPRSSRRRRNSLGRFRTAIPAPAVPPPATWSVRSTSTPAGRRPEPAGSRCSPPSSPTLRGAGLPEALFKQPPQSCIANTTIMVIAVH